MTDNKPEISLAEAERQLGVHIRTPHQESQLGSVQMTTEIKPTTSKPKPKE